MKKIAIFCPALTSIRGGIEKTISLIVSNIDLNEYHITILCMPSSNSGRYTVFPIPQRIDIREMDAYDINSIKNTITELDPDGVFVFGSGLIMFLFAYALRNTEYPLVTSDRAAPEYSENIYWFQRPDLFHLAINFSDYFQILMPSFVSYYPEKFHSKIFPIPNPILIPDAMASPGESEDDIKRIVCFARFDKRQKGQDCLIDAFSKIAANFPGWQLHLYGDDRAGFKNELFNKINFYKLQNQIYIHDSILDVNNILKKANICAFPSIYEGFGNSLAEALAIGLPSVGFKDAPAVNELIIDNYNGFLANGNQDAEALSITLMKLMSNPELCKTFGLNARESAQRFTIDKALVIYLDLFKLVCNLKGKNRLKSLSKMENSILDVAYSSIDGVYVNKKRHKKAVNAKNIISKGSNNINIHGYRYHQKEAFKAIGRRIKKKYPNFYKSLSFFIKLIK